MRENTNVEPRIALTVTPDGVESISILPGGGADGRTAGYSLCSCLDQAINDFDEAVRRSIGDSRSKPKEQGGFQ